MRTRRSFLATLLSPPILALVGIGRTHAEEGPARLGLTPECGHDDGPTIAQTEGPFFKPNTPPRHDLASGATRGSRITIAGFVVDGRCKPLPGSLVEIWHADDDGRYDNTGFRLRGHQQADDHGRWWFSTIVPAAYAGRTRHYHFKVQRPGRRPLTTQLYFPDEPLNARDGLFDQRLVLHLTANADEKFGRYDFVV